MAKEQLIFTDQDKERRAKDLYLLLIGKRPLDTGLSAEHKDHMFARFTEFLQEAKIDIKKASEDEVVLFIYKKLGGLVRTIAQQEKVKESVKKFNIAKTKAKVEEEGVADDDDADDDDDK